MAHSSHTKSSVSIDLFNLPPLPDAKKHSTMISEIPNDFFLPDGKNTQLSKVVNTWTFDRLTPNGNEGVGIKLDCLEHAYGTKYFVIDKVNGDINAIHDESLELTEFKDVSDLSTWMIWKQRLADYPKGPETKKMMLNKKLHLDYVSETRGRSTWMNMKEWDSK